MRRKAEGRWSTPTAPTDTVTGTMTGSDEAMTHPGGDASFLRATDQLSGDRTKLEGHVSQVGADADRIGNPLSDEGDKAASKEGPLGGGGDGDDDDEWQQKFTGAARLYFVLELEKKVFWTLASCKHLFCVIKNEHFLG